MDVESIVAMILKHRPDLSREDVLGMAREKMRSIGAGYLTEQGALFLVAADLGIRIDEEMSRLRMNSSGGGTVIALKDLYSGARDVSIVARVMKIYPVKRYSRSDGTLSRLRRLVVYDNEKSMGMNLWDEAADAIERLGIKAGDAIRVSRAYVKSGLNGSSLVINTGMKSSVELVGSCDDTGMVKEKGMSSIGVEIKGLEDISIDVSDVASWEGKVDGDNLVVTGVICSNPMISTYRNRDGEESRVMSMILQGSTSRVRVVVWDLNYANLARFMPINSKVMVTGVKVRRDVDRVELHGDAGSIVRVLHGGDDRMVSSDASSSEEDYLGLMRLRILAVNSIGGYSIDDGSLATAHTNASSSSRGRYAIVVDVGDAKDDESKAVYLLDISSLRYEVGVGVHDDMIIECIPSRILGYTIYLDEDSYIASSKGKDEYAKGAGYKPEPISKIADAVKEEHLYAIEAIVLTMPRVDEVRRRDGSVSRRAEVLVGDDTREARLVAWDKQVEGIEALRVGERIRLYGVVARRRRVAARRRDDTYENYDDVGEGNYQTMGPGDGTDVYELNLRHFTIIRHIG